MTKAEELLASGIRILSGLMTVHGFLFVPTDSGRSSGGEYASGECRRGNRVLELHFRYSLGLVHYHIGSSSIVHEDYMWSAIGERHASEYPGFSADPLDGFRHLLHDLEGHGIDFLRGSDAQFRDTCTACREVSARHSRASMKAGQPRIPDDSPVLCASLCGSPPGSRCFGAGKTKELERPFLRHCI